MPDLIAVERRIRSLRDARPKQEDEAELVTA